MARTHEKYELTAEDRRALETLLRSPKAAQSLVLRARIVLHSGSGQTAEEVAASLGTSKLSVYKWRNRFKTSGIDGLEDLPRSGQPKKLSAAKVKEVLTLTVERIPKEATHWSVRLMAKAAGITTWQVRQIWEASDLKPHRLKTFKISNDPEFAEKVVDVVGLYMNPPDNALVLSVDEKTQIQALDRTQPMLPLRPGQIERRTHDYRRNGTTSLYAAFDILTGKVIGRTTKRHRAKEFLDFLRQIDCSTPRELDLHLILDNSSTHKTPEVQTWLAEPSAVHLALHANQRLLAQRGGGLVLPTGASRYSPGCFYQRGGAAQRDPSVSSRFITQKVPSRLNGQKVPPSSSILCDRAKEVN